jgi:electron transfer flavoprotein beta subunit
VVNGRLFEEKMTKILVPLKRVPDYQTKVKVAPDGKGIVTDGIKWIVNPFDEIAVEEAIRMKEKGSDIEIVVVSIGPAGTTEQLRTALAMGADRAILVVTDEQVDSFSAHQILAKLYEKEQPSLIIMGKQAIDSDANQTGQLLASKLGLPQATFASKLVVEADWSAASITREVDGGLETIKVSLPAIVTTDLRLNEPRYPSLPGIVKAKKKQLDEIKPSELGLTIEPKITVLKMEAPPKRKGGVKVASAEELVAKLRDEAKVL